MKRKLYRQLSCAVLYAIYRFERSQCMWLDFLFCFLLLLVFVGELEITNTGIDSFYSSIKTLSSATAFLHNVEEFRLRLFGFYFKICMRRHQGKRLEGKRNLRICGVAKQQCFSFNISKSLRLPLTLFETFLRNISHFTFQSLRPQMLHAFSLAWMNFE